MKLDLEQLDPEIGADSHPESEHKLPKSLWTKMVAQYQQPDVRTSIWQVINSFGGFLLTWCLMWLSLRYSYVLTLALSVPAAGFLMRIFIIQHDCGHGSFLKSRSVSDVIGTIAGILTLTPYRFWRKSHAIHHASASNLEERGVGDVYTMTVSEYLEASRWERLKYRVYRNPVFLFGIVPGLLFIVLYRFPYSDSKNWKKEDRHSVYWTNLAIAGVVAGMCLLIGWREFLLIQLPITLISASAGTFLFYVQHQFEDTYRANKPEWEYALAAMQGSSYYQMPRVFQWFTGNIGFHHIHHLSPRIPNYRLEQCHNENPLFQRVVVLTFWSSLRTMFLTLWDEKQKKLISFGELSTLRQSSAGSV
ncbi:MAG: fatty acid desaturase [Chloroflexota bacterium]|nr:fatty acid desaturase [Chloroflexota bacterium]